MSGVNPMPITFKSYFGLPVSICTTTANTNHREHTTSMNLWNIVVDFTLPRMEQQ